METSRERVDSLIHLSDQVYPILEQKIDGELRARRIVRLGMATVAISLREGMTPSEAGGVFDDMLTYELRDMDFGKFVERGEYARSLQPPQDIVVPPKIARLANRYSDVRRATYLTKRMREPDSVHALHLASWAVPYAQIYYPELDRGKVALYSLIHDLPEAYAGDVPTVNIPKKIEAQKLRDETAATHRIHDELYGEWPEFVEILEAYEELNDSESRYTRTSDKCEPGFTHQANNASSLRDKYNITNRRKFYASARKTEKRMSSYATGFPLLVEDFREQARRIAQAFDN